MSSDFALAAAYASGKAPPAQAFAHPGPASRPPGPRRGQPSAMEEDYEVEEMGQLPVVDDLEVAALAAAAGMEAQAALAGGGSSSESSSSDESGSSDEESSEDEDLQSGAGGWLGRGREGWRAAGGCAAGGCTFVVLWRPHF